MIDNAYLALIMFAPVLVLSMSSHEGKGRLREGEALAMFAEE
jgi:hypothetical protein